VSRNPAITPKMQRAMDTVDALVALMQVVDKRDPRFMVTMRRYGLLNAIEAVMNANADVMGEVAAEYAKRGI
jgi:hypothetical protein